MLLRARASRVQLIVDHNAGIGALIERSRVGGVVVADAGRRGLRLEYVPTLADVRVGDVVITSGARRYLPQGLRHRPGDARGPGQQRLRSIGVVPAWTSPSLEEVLIVLGPATGRQG